MSAIEFSAEAITDETLNTVLRLAEGHHRESDPLVDFPLTKSIAFYKAAATFLRLFTARMDGEIVGYAIYIVQPHPHYEPSLQAQCDLVYMTPIARRWLNGYLFMKFCEEQLAETGVQAVYVYSSFRREIGPVLRRLGHEPIQTLYARRLSR